MSAGLARFLFRHPAPNARPIDPAACAPWHRLDQDHRMALVEARLADSAHAAP